MSRCILWKGTFALLITCISGTARECVNFKSRSQEAIGNGVAVQTLGFRVDDHCLVSTVFIIVSDSSNTLCMFAHSSDSFCTSSEAECICNEEDKTFILQKTVFRKPVGQVWTFAGLSKDRVRLFNSTAIIYVPDIPVMDYLKVEQPGGTTVLTANTSTQQSVILNPGNGDIIVYCSLERNSYHPQTIRLVVPDNVTITVLKRGITDIKEVQLTGPPCAQSGRYICDAEGSMEKRSILILMKCPIQITNKAKDKAHFDVSVGDSFSHTFGLRSYTINLTCKLTRPTTFELRNGEPCNRYIRIQGLLPELQVTLTWSNVSVTDKGLWILALSNDVGDPVFIYLHVFITTLTRLGMLEATSTPDKNDKTEQVSSNTLQMSLSVAAVTFSIAIGCAMWCVHMKKVKGKCAKAVLQIQNTTADRPMSKEPSPDDSQSSLGKFYEEINHLPDTKPPQCIGQAILPPVLPCRKCVNCHLSILHLQKDVYCSANSDNFANAEFSPVVIIQNPSTHSGSCSPRDYLHPIGADSASDETSSLDGYDQPFQCHSSGETSPLPHSCPSLTKMHTLRVDTSEGDLLDKFDQQTIYLKPINTSPDS